MRKIATLVTLSFAIIYFESEDTRKQFATNPVKYLGGS